MNKIEQMFYDAFIEAGEELENISAQVPIGIYIADFVMYPKACIPTIIEIDGQEFHKTKEQRFADYKKERFFMSEGYAVIRYRGSEVYVNSRKCAEEAITLSGVYDGEVIEAYRKGGMGKCLKRNVITG